PGRRARAPAAAAVGPHVRRPLDLSHPRPGVVPEVQPVGGGRRGRRILRPVGAVVAEGPLRRSRDRAERSPPDRRCRRRRRRDGAAGPAAGSAPRERGGLAVISRLVAAAAAALLPALTTAAPAVAAPAAELPCPRPK